MIKLSSTGRTPLTGICRFDENGFMLQEKMSTMPLLQLALLNRNLMKHNKGQGNKD